MRGLDLNRSFGSCVLVIGTCLPTYRLLLRLRLCEESTALLLVELVKRMLVKQIACSVPVLVRDEVH